MTKIKIYLCESYTTILAREPIEIELDSFSEMKGMSKEEILKFINENMYNMSPTNNGLNLYDELNQMDIIHDKCKNNKSWVEIEECDECGDEDDYNIEEVEE
jgi:hypothetical protein